MAYITAEARQELLDDIAAAIDEIGSAVALLGAGYELLDEHTADRLEAELFRPLQAAYGRAKRTHAAFGQRHAVAGRALAATPSRTLPSAGAKELIDAAVEAVAEADAILADLQDSMRPVDVGDAELRAGLAEVRRLLDRVPGGARRLQRVLGR